MCIHFFDKFSMFVRQSIFYLKFGVLKINTNVIRCSYGHFQKKYRYFGGL